MDKKYIAYVYNRTLSAKKKKSMSFFKKKICENRRTVSEEGSRKEMGGTYKVME